MKEAYRKSEDLFSSENECQLVLPPWAMTWPAGQLSGIGRNGQYANNIKRYEMVFSKVFSECKVARRPARNADVVPAGSNLSYVNVIPLDFLKDEAKRKETLASLINQIDGRRGDRHRSLRGPDFHVSNEIHRNANSILSNSSLEPTRSEAKQLEELFLKDSAELATMTGLNLGWFEDSRVASSQ